ncbi:hypothetical protein E4U12_006832 [Claviceps purpurea]|nr:hypothetical protein E4U12_006832 [Claviceps purpurea]KAG6127506.1 hypothetical protein E4U28_000099 [Claviceps purpurea]
MARIQIPLDALTSRFNLGDRFSGFTSGPLTGRFSNLRSVSEFFDFKRVSKPANFGEMQSRVNYNLSHFSSNYAVVFLMLSLYALLTNWLLLFDITLVVVGMWFIGRLDGRDLEIGTFRATSSQLYTGLLIVSVPLCLVASPFSTLLWLIGASGVTILGHASGGGLGGRPRAPKFAPQWGRPSRRGRRKTDGDAAHYSSWGIDPRVQELGTEGEETDTQGAGLSLRHSKRFVSDSLDFTGTDLGDRSSGTHRRRIYSDSDEEDDADSGESASEESDDEDGGYGFGYFGNEEENDDPDGYLARMGPDEREEVLLRSALYLISRAQAMGASDVHLNKQELEAYGRYLQRMEQEERARQKKKKRTSGGGSDKKKKNKKKLPEQRMAVPLTQLAPTSRKKKSSSVSRAELPPRQDSLPRQRPATDLPPDGRDRKGYPAMGYFPPPSTSRSRPGSASAASRPPSAARQYEYSSPPSSSKRAPSSRDSPRDEASHVGSRSHNDSSGSMNPFLFQTSGPRTPYSPATSSKRTVPGSAERTHEQRRGTTTPAARSGRGSRRASYDEYTAEESSPVSEESTTDEGGNEAPMREQEREREREREPAARASRRGRSNVIVVEESPERRGSKKKSSSSPVKRKPVGGKKKKK